jgi:hypothetical protein
MKKSEMDKLRELEEDWRQFGYHDCIVGRLQRLLDTFEVDRDPEEIKTELEAYVEKWAGDPEVDNPNWHTCHGCLHEDQRSCDIRDGLCNYEEKKTEIDQHNTELLDHMQTPENKEAIKKAWDNFGKPKRQWHTWSDLKKKFFSPKKIEEMKKQAMKELEEKE